MTEVYLAWVLKNQKGISFLLAAIINIIKVKVMNWVKCCYYIY